MSSPANPPGPLSPDDALPPVEPPSAGFILRLFVAPAVIVFIIVLAWVAINWWARRGSDPSHYIEALKRNNEARWQAAVNLANALQNPGNTALKHDAAIAGQLAELLDEEIEKGDMKDNSLLLRVFLCRALGEFAVPDVLPTLLKAATVDRDERETSVRCAAIEAMAVLVSNVPQIEPTRNPEMVSALLQAARDPADPLVRSTAAFALGVVGGDQAIDQLEVMLVDAYPDVRFNAATALARHGNECSIEVLLTMLDPAETAGIDIEEQEAAHPFKRTLILVNALRATSQLAERNPLADLGPLYEASKQLLQAELPAEVRLRAKEALGHLEKRSLTPAEKP